ncbi:cytidine/deoxycytidylate deaminase family protein [Spelaeicoccus albus]|uniref:Cytidine deaminase n=1 Tax=Spelaeicoccus albus TaxID=1280376 RepID=A0A7Z0D3M4_9MICO|nr:hypothetical protein [Spelaeicoccus albus]NYI68267.1 cytidine deaminase [Spelaeicoccus albus]
MNDEAVTLSALSQADVNLRQLASDLLLRTHDGVKHRVAAAARGESGRSYLGVNLGSNRVNICAEPSALANAAIAGEAAIETIVAVGMGTNDVPQVINPCGVCRELIPNFAPAARIIVNDCGDVRPVLIDDLLPIPWVRARNYD